MTSKVLFLVISLLLLPVSVSGKELLLQVLSSARAFKEVDSVELVQKDSKRSFYRFNLEGENFWAVCEETKTKSGAVTYTAVFDKSLKIVHFDIPQYDNKHNASLTSSAFLRQFRKESPAEKPIQIGYGVDAISGATSSTLSIIDVVNASSLDLQEIVKGM